MTASKLTSMTKSSQLDLQVTSIQETIRRFILLGRSSAGMK
jgi:hypothetical protein